MSYEENEGEFLYHTACDVCGSSDNRAVYNTGTSYCFGCGVWSREEGSEAFTRKSNRAVSMDLLKYDYKDVAKRKIPEQIAKQYRYGYAVDSNGEQCQVANYFNKDKELVAQKLRYRDKKFKFIGDAKSALLYGQQLWGNTGKKLVITEGEIDALSVATAFDGKYPVVSLKNGAQAAKKEISAQLDWINGYEEVYLWFDTDDVGRKAVEDCVNILPADKVRIIRHADYKDANEVLCMLGRAGVVNSFYNAEKYKPDDIVKPSDLLDTVAEPITVGFPYYYDKLTQLMYGRRFGEIVVVGAGVSVGKTDFVMSQIAHDVQQGWKVATFMLEQSTKETLLRTAGKLDGCH